MPAQLPHHLCINSSIAYDNSYAADFFRVLENSIKQSIIQKLQIVEPGKKESYDYNVHVKFDTDINTLTPRFYFHVQIDKLKITGYDWSREYISKNNFNLVTEKMNLPDITPEKVLEETEKQIQKMIYKFILVDMLFEKLNLNMDDYGIGINIDIKKEDDKVEYRLSKTAGYKYNSKVETLVDNWMTLEEIKAIVEIINE